ncbi:MAG: HEPN domain-containing protein [Candidatus Diapherotrites archaeon]|nr:HEPN domain-containing protein [Candidatus Diapherotrites archaeon]
MISLKECEEEGLIKRIAPSPRQAEEQLNKARALLEEAKGDVKDNRPNNAIIGGYAAMFDAARAVLFRDGYIEKSHACVARYLEVKYPSIDSSYIHLLDQYRIRRHKVMYSGDYFPTIKEARNLVEFAEDFIELVEKLLKK